MRSPLKVLSILLLATSALFAAPGNPFRVLPSPSGCVVVFDAVPAEFRVDGLAGGGASVELTGMKLEAREQQLTEGCLASYRVSPSYDGKGTRIELAPSGVEFSAVIRQQGGLQVVFDKVTELSPAAAGSTAGHYRIGVGDSLQITVYSHPDLTKEAIIVGADGKINYSLLGDIAVGGRTVREVQEEITAALGKDYVVNPQVSVEVRKYASQFVYIAGQVKNPQRVPLEGGTTLKDALAAAGGLTPDAGYTITVARKAVGSDGRPREPEQTMFSRRDIEMGLANFVLQPDDIVTVSDKDWFYISREVHKPGRYEITPGLTLYQAIAVAEGPTDWADLKKVTLIRKVGGETVSQVVNLKAIERQKTPDIPLVAGDSIIIPKRFL